MPPRPDLQRLLARAALVAGLAQAAPALTPMRQDPPDGYDALLALFGDWRAFERPPLVDGAPDYTAARMAAARRELARYRARLEAIDPSAWPVEQQVDWHLVRAELNGLDFDCRVLRPWARDPAFYKSVWTYQSDTPAHEGPTHHALLELWTYAFPLSADEERRLVADLRGIPPLLAQARGNLTGNARDLWVAGIEDLRGQAADLEQLARTVGDGAGAALEEALEDALRATRALVTWLEEQAPSKTGPSGVGRENYTWYLQNVHLVPLTWEDEVRLLKRELDRAWSSLRLEEHRNRDLPALVPAASPQEYDALAERGVARLMTFLGEREVLRVEPWMEPALRAHVGRFVPEPERNFFWIAAHHDPTPLYTHFYHWWDLARMRAEPHQSPVRRGPLLYNIFDSRAEGVATGVEELYMHAGLYDDAPRVREIVWIMLAQRAARGLGSLYAHANEMTMEEAGRVHVEWTPRGWMATEPELLRFEQHLYLRQPGYGTSYVTGKYLLERLLAEWTQQREEPGGPLALAEFFAELDAAGVIPLSLIRWQLTGRDDEIRRMTGR